MADKKTGGDQINLSRSDEAALDNAWASLRKPQTPKAKGSGGVKKSGGAPKKK